MEHLRTAIKISAGTSCQVKHKNMQSTHVFFASSLNEVLAYLRFHRLSGMLTIQRADLATQKVGMVLQIEQGQAVYVQSGNVQQPFDELVLRFLLGWGPIHFTFSHLRQSNQISAPSRKTTRPLPDGMHLPVSSRRSYSLSTNSELSKMPKFSEPPMDARHLSINPAIIPVWTVRSPETVILSLSRHDRTIFLLINGHRTVQDLAQITHRSLDSVQESLQHLADQQIISRI